MLASPSHKSKPDFKTGFPAWRADLVQRVHEKRQRRGLVDRINHLGVEGIIENGLGRARMPLWPYCDTLSQFNKPEAFERVLSDPARKRAFFRYILSSTPEITYADRFRAVDHWLASYLAGVPGHQTPSDPEGTPIPPSLPSKRSARILDAGCGFDLLEGYSPTTRDLVRILGHRRLKADVLALDLKVLSSGPDSECPSIFYRRFDLLSPSLARFGSFDAIRLLNVGYYFEPPIRDALIRRLLSMLVPRGVLIEDSRAALDLYKGQKAVRPDSLSLDGEPKPMDDSASRGPCAVWIHRKSPEGKTAYSYLPFTM